MSDRQDEEQETPSSAEEGAEKQMLEIREAPGVYGAPNETTSSAVSSNTGVIDTGVINPIGSKTERLAVVAAQAAVCVACGLSRTRNKVVFGEGNPEAPLMLIGEGPGQNEDSTGRPFVGRAGVLLDACLKENGITRKHIYITNVVRCRPTLVEAGAVKNRPPTPEEVRACSNWLEQTIEIVQPRVILCLGAPAANAIIHKGFKMAQERSQWFESKYSRYALAAWHPAYILRQEGEAYEAARRSLVNDIAAARQKVIEAKREPKMTLF